ncbi:MAG: 3-dehydroquinate synthase family protein, partial [Streptococcus sp.]|nr:3-dehydroquinate synthase family protein [Streptococcus sp.]
VPFVQIPTSLLAMVDSSVGGKTAIDLPSGKNLVGAFKQPKLVLCDVETLESLPENQFRDGCAEVIKYGMLYDSGLLKMLSVEGSGFDREAVIAKCICYKRDVVQDDEFDTGLRQKLNLGHTIGHAVEATAGYGKVMHGEAVAIGMVQISRVAEAKGLMPKGITKEIFEMCQKFGLPTDYQPWDVEVLYGALVHDKKARGKMIKTVIVPELGSAAINQIPLEEMKEYLEK